MQIHEIYSALESPGLLWLLVQEMGPGVQEQRRLQGIFLMAHLKLWQMQHSRLLHRKGHFESHLPACDQRLPAPPKKNHCRLK